MPRAATEDIEMHRSGRFDVIDDSSAHVTNSRPIRKSQSHLRPDKFFRCSSTDAAIADAVKPLPRPRLASTSAGTSPTTHTENNHQHHPPAVTTSAINAAGYQPQSAETVSKSGVGEFKPEVKYRQIPPMRSPEQNGSLRDRWRQLNDEFKRLYQRNSTSPQTTPSQGHRPHFQGQTKFTKVNRFKDVDQRFSMVSRAVSNMSARHIHNTTSGPSAMTSPKPEVLLRSTTSGGESGVRIPETVTEERFRSESPTTARHLYTEDSVIGYVKLSASRRPPSDERPILHQQFVETGWYPASKSHDERQGSSLHNRLPGRGANSERSKQIDCKYKTVCKRCGKIIIASPASEDDDDDDDDVRSQSITSSRGTYAEDKRPFRRMVILSVLCRLLLTDLPA